MFPYNFELASILQYIAVSPEKRLNFSYLDSDSNSDLVWGVAFNIISISLKVLFPFFQSAL